MKIKIFKSFIYILFKLCIPAEKYSEISESATCPLKKMTKLPLHEAVLSGDETIVGMCLASGAFIDTQQANGETAVHIAASRGHVHILKVSTN